MGARRPKVRKAIAAREQRPVVSVLQQLVESERLRCISYPEKLSQVEHFETKQTFKAWVQNQDLHQTRIGK